MFLKRAERERAEGMEGVEWAHSGKRRGRTEGGEPNEGNVFALPRRTAARATSKRETHRATMRETDNKQFAVSPTRYSSRATPPQAMEVTFGLVTFICGTAGPGGEGRQQRWRERLLPSGREGRRKGRSSKHSQAKAEGETRKPIKHGNHALPLRPRAAGTVTLHSLGSYVLSFWRLRDCSPYLSFAVLLSWPNHEPELKAFNENIVSRSCLIIGMRDLDKWIVLPHNMQELPMLRTR